jgi:hypothetical protein
MMSGRHSRRALRGPEALTQTPFFVAVISRIINWLRASPGSPGRRETHFVRRIHFLSAQQGPIEQEFAQRLQPILSQAHEVRTAFLCRVHYGNPDEVRVALCLRCQCDDLESNLLLHIHATFAEIFAPDQSLDILPLNDLQERNARAVTGPFYESKTAR